MSEFTELIGKKVECIRMDEDHLILETHDGTFYYEVEGDCCSHSYFYDFHGVEKLLKNGGIAAVNAVDLDDPDDEDSRRGEVVAAYGIEFVTVHPHWGEQTSVMSFRNDSNGYYGGWMSRVHSAPPDEVPALAGECVLSRPS